MPFIVVAIVALCIAVFALPRLSINRKPGVEGVLDAAAVDSYDRLSWSPQHRFIQPRLVNELKKHKPTGRLVNIGCGPGYLEAVVARELPGLTVTGVDIGAAMLRAARRNLGAVGLADRAYFFQGDVHRLPIAAASIDTVMSAVSLHHWRDAAEAMAEVHRVLKPGGQFLIFDLRRDTRRWFYWALWFLEVFFVSRQLRSVDSPLDSLRASYTPAEVSAILSRGDWERSWVRGGAGWMLVWGSKPEN